MSMPDDSVAAPVLPAPMPRRGRMALFEFLRTLRDNMVATYSQEAYEREIVATKILGRRRFIVSEPAAIRHVLIDNAANYQKSEITRRILEPGLGKGLITSEGETWRRHRRTIAPAFDHRSIASYTPIMTGAAQQLLRDWDRRSAGASVDIAAAMMEVTLNIISRTMFSSDSDRILGIIERGAGRYQARMRPNIMDFLGFPAWLASLPRVRIVDRTLGEFNLQIERLIRVRSDQYRRRHDGSAGPADRGARRADRWWNERTGSARPHHHDLHGGTRDNGHGADLDVVPVVAASGRGGQAACGTGGRTRRPGTDRGGSRAAHLYAHDHRRIDASLSAGPHDRSRGASRRHARGPSYPERIDGADRPVGIASASQALEGSAAIPA